MDDNNDYNDEIDNDINDDKNIITNHMINTDSYSYNNNGSLNGTSGIISLVLIGIIVVIGLIAFNVIPSPFGSGNSSEIAFKEKSVRLQKNASLQLSLTTVGNNIKYKSSNEKVVSVNELTGYVTGVSNGTATITAYDGNDTVDSCTVEVYTPTYVVNISKLKLSESKLYLYVGGTKQLKVTYSPSNATNKKVIWSSSNKNVATINSNGVVTAKGVGTATIKIRTEDGVNATCTVTVSKKPTTTKKTSTSSSSSSTSTSSTTTTPSTTTITKYTLTYDANGGSVSPASKTLNKGDKYGDLPTPTRSEYKFSGWYTSASGGSLVDSSTTISGNTTIYAHWKQKNTNGYSVGPGNEAEGIGRTITYKGRTFKHYYQDKINYVYGHGYSITANGCGPTSLAIILSGYPELSNTTPQAVADKVGQYGTFNLLMNVARGYGMTVEGPRYYNSNDRNQAAINRLAAEANQKLKDGYQIIALVSGNGGCWGCSVANKYSTGNHFIAIVGIANDGQALIANPLSVKSSEGTMEEIIKWYMPSGGKGLIYLKK